MEASQFPKKVNQGKSPAPHAQGGGQVTEPHTGANLGYGISLPCQGNRRGLPAVLRPPQPVCQGVRLLLRHGEALPQVVHLLLPPPLRCPIP